MRTSMFSIARVLFLGFTLGALLGRRWKGGLADGALSLVAVATLALWALWLARYMQSNDHIAIGKHLVLEHLHAQWTLRVEDLGQFEYIELRVGPAPRTEEIAASGESRVPAVDIRRTIIEQPWRVGALGLACTLTLAILLVLPAMPTTSDFTVVILAWLLAIAAYLVAVAPRSVPRPSLSFWWHAHWPVAITLGGITLIALVVRVWQLGSIPFTLAGDEATFGVEALRMVQGQVRDPFVTGPLGQPNMSFVIGGLGVRLMGLTMEAVRLPWALIGVLTVPVAFWLVARLTNTGLGLLTAALVAVYHFHIHFSRLSINNIGDPFLVGLALLFLYRAKDRGSAFDWALVGATCGAALYLYQGARVIPVLVILIAGYVAVTERGWLTRQRGGLVVALGGLLIVGAPMLQFALRFPDDYNARINQMGIIQSGWLESAMSQGQSMGSVLLDQFLRSALAFNVYADRTVWYGLRGPLLDPSFGLLFLIGLGYATITVLRPGGDRRLFPMVAWWWSATIFGGMLTQNPPSSMRLVTLALPVCFFIALAVVKLAQLVPKLNRLPARVLLPAVWLVFAVISLKTYFVEFSPTRIYGGSSAEVATALAKELHVNMPSSHIYFFGAPITFWTFPTFPFFFPGVQAVDMSEPLTAPPPSEWMWGGYDSIFIFLPQRRAELELVRQTFPRGEIAEIESGDHVVATVYSVAP